LIDELPINRLGRLGRENGADLRAEVETGLHECLVLGLRVRKLDTQLSRSLLQDAAAEPLELEGDPALGRVLRLDPKAHHRL
jgi:hypothetical protein